MGDAHFCDYVPIKRTDDFLDAQFRKLDKIRELSDIHQVEVVILLGDVFDKARPAMWLVNKVINYLNKFNVPVYSVVGNHDIQGSRDGVSATALGTLFEAGVIKELSGDMNIGNIPVRGIPHTREHTVDLYKSNEPRLMFTHNMITPQRAPFTHLYVGDVVDGVKGNFIFAGDFHPPFERYNATNKTRVVNPGVMVRTDIAEKVITPSVILFEASTQPNYIKVDFKKIPLGAAAGDTVFDVERHEKEKEKELNLKQFIESIKSTQFQSQDIEKLVQEVGKESKVSTDVITEALDRIKSAKASI